MHRPGRCPRTGVDRAAHASARIDHSGTTGILVICSQHCLCTLGLCLFSSDGQSGRLVSGRSSVRSRQEARRAGKSVLWVYVVFSTHIILTLGKCSRSLPPNYGLPGMRAERPPTRTAPSRGREHPLLSRPPFLFSAVLQPGRNGDSAERISHANQTSRYDGWRSCQQ